jgi:glycine cleavage system protein P-like pyridoxal-binding family
VGPVIDGGLLVAVTERRTREEIDRFVKAFEEAVS